MDARNSWGSYPDAQGRFGQFGGRFVAETLMPNILALQQAYEDAKAIISAGRKSISSAMNSIIPGRIRSTIAWARFS